MIVGVREIHDGTSASSAFVIAAAIVRFGPLADLVDVNAHWDVACDDGQLGLTGQQGPVTQAAEVRFGGSHIALEAREPQQPRFGGQPFYGQVAEGHGYTMLLGRTELATSEDPREALADRSEHTQPIAVDPHSAHDVRSTFFFPKALCLWRKNTTNEHR